MNSRRTAIVAAAVSLAGASRHVAAAQDAPGEPDRRWYEAAAQMRRQAEATGDQPYGAALVLGGVLVAQSPSRVVARQNPAAHAEREAIRAAQQKLGRDRLEGAVLYSTSRPCPLCEAAAAQAGVSRMYFGPSMTDGGVPGRQR